MTETPGQPAPTDLRSAFVTAANGTGARPVWLVGSSGWPESLVSQGDGPAEVARAWLQATGYQPTVRRFALLPDAGGGMAGAVLGIGDTANGRSAEPAETLVGLLPTLLPPGDWRLASRLADMPLAALAWGLGSYRFRRYKSGASETLPRLVMPEGIDGETVALRANGIALGRDLINTPTSDMGPAELDAAARRLGLEHGATVTSIVGDDLLAGNFPLLHAVGRASASMPRLIDLVAGRPQAPKVTIIGKGICFDTGGLDIKPASGMLLMKKDMGGAAAALALAHMILAARVDVRLRVIIAAAENSISGNAFRPGDVIASRSGKTVEIGNTDAEGRLVLADALSLADEEAPEHLFTFATLTGAARVALGPEIMPFFTDDDGLATALSAAGAAVADPLWRLPLTTPYESWLDSHIADMNNVADGGFAGAIVGAMFLKRFVRRARRFAHFDIYGWRPQARPMGPRGGEAHAARAVLEVLLGSYGTRTTG